MLSDAERINEKAVTPHEHAAISESEDLKYAPAPRAIECRSS